MLAICTIYVMVNVGGFNMEAKADIEGIIVKESESKYIMDFRKGLKKYPKVVEQESYDKKLVDKNDCVKE